MVGVTVNTYNVSVKYDMGSGETAVKNNETIVIFSCVFVVTGSIPTAEACSAVAEFVRSFSAYIVTVKVFSSLSDISTCNVIVQCVNSKYERIEHIKFCRNTNYESVSVIAVINKVTQFSVVVFMSVHYPRSNFEAVVCKFSVEHYGIGIVFRENISVRVNTEPSETEADIVVYSTGEVDTVTAAVKNSGTESIRRSYQSLTTHANFNIGGRKSPVDVSQTHTELCSRGVAQSRITVKTVITGTPAEVAVLEQNGSGKVFGSHIVKTETYTGSGIEVFGIVMGTCVTVAEFFSELSERFEFGSGSSACKRRNYKAGSQYECSKFFHFIFLTEFMPKRQMQKKLKKTVCWQICLIRK